MLNIEKKKMLAIGVKLICDCDCDVCLGKDGII